jgi:CheY-like chemotaxis protein
MAMGYGLDREARRKDAAVPFAISRSRLSGPNPTPARPGGRPSARDFGATGEAAMYAHLIRPPTALVRNAAPGARTERLCLLLADGDADVHAIYGAVLEREGFQVLHAFSAAECLRLARTPRMCAALVSVGGCGLLSWRLLHGLAASAAARGFVIVCLTTDPRLTPAARRPPRGVSTVLMLPCAPDALTAEVHRVLLPGGSRPN